MVQREKLYKLQATIMKRLDKKEQIYLFPKNISFSQRRNLVAQIFVRFQNKKVQP